ncbi:MAG: hypothetical protein RLZZ210_1048 [Pseudomonadota bacterium]|jgi:histidinol-phosphate aminotransferase
MNQNIEFLQLDNIIRQDVLNAQSYAVHSSQGMIKLDAMENPFTLPQQLQNELAQHLSKVDLNRYPSPESYKKTVDIIRNYANIHDDLDILLGNGSDEIITILANLLPENSYILSPLPSFVMYKISAELSKLNFASVDLTADNFDLYVNAFKQAITQYQPKLIYISYPNNPTGSCFSTDDINQIIEHVAQQSLIIIDEAYQAFTGNKTYMHDLPNIMQKHPNVLVMRTLSKVGLAGLRLGYIAGHKEVIAQLDKVRPPYNINVLTQATVQFLLGEQKNIDILNQQASKICEQRLIMRDKLAKFGHVFDSDANFLLVRMNKDAGYVQQQLKEKGILIKNVSGLHKNLHNCLRFSIGTEEENERVIKELESL